MIFYKQSLFKKKPSFYAYINLISKKYLDFFYHSIKSTSRKNLFKIVNMRVFKIKAVNVRDLNINTTELEIFYFSYRFHILENSKKNNKSMLLQFFLKNISIKRIFLYTIEQEITPMVKNKTNCIYVFCEFGFQNLILDLTCIPFLMKKICFSKKINKKGISFVIKINFGKSIKK